MRQFGIALLVLASAPVSAQEKEPPAPAINTAVGLGGGPAMRAVGQGIGWLRVHQARDGHWAGGDGAAGGGAALSDVGATGLALLAFLGDGHTARMGPHRDVVKNASRWLRGAQGEDGRLGENSSTLDHAIATWAMVESYGLSEYRLLREPAARAAAALLEARHEDGAWHRGGAVDVWASCWGAMALRAALDFELIEADALRPTRAWALGLAERASDVAADAEAFPALRAESVGGAAWMLGYMLAATDAERPEQSEVDAWRRKLRDWQPGAGGLDPHGWQWTTYALYQAGGRSWRGWSRRLETALVEAQHADGEERGSWDPVAAYAGWGRVGTTALCTLALEARYRYTRLSGR